jgi:protein-S-isoprenylcysteine O-methyltransferase Ste14
MPDPDDLDRSEIEAVIETRRELGSAYEPALVDSFVEKVESAIEARVDARLAERQRSEAMERRHSGQQLALGIVSLVAAIAITIPLAVTDHLPAVIVSWIGIAVVNMAYAMGRQRGT